MRANRNHLSVDIRSAALSTLVTMLVVTPPALAQETGQSTSQMTETRIVSGRTGAGYRARSMTKPQPRPQTDDAFEDWINGPSALGEWGGYRRKLEDRGITLSGFNANNLQNNTGGLQNEWAWANSTMAALDFDFEKLAGLRGFLIHGEVWWAGGRNLSTIGIGNLFNVATAYTPPGWYLGQLYAQQQLFDDKLTLQLGRMTTANNFASLPIFSDYVSVAVNALPVSLPVNTVPFTAPPATEWGAVATLKLSKDLDVAAGVYNGSRASSALVGTNGLNWAFDPDQGVMGVVQIAYSPHREADALGMPGTFYVGAFYDGGSYTALNGPQTSRGNYGFYAMGQQIVYRETPGSDQGLTLWVATVYQGQQSINLLPVFAAAGGSYMGIIPGRNHDTAAVAAYYGKVSNAQPPGGATQEIVVEVNYTYWLTRWFGVTPDFQYVFNPSGAGISNAAVFGGQIQIIF